MTFALTVRQPWASAIMLGKDVENRSWPTHHRGPLLVHAGTGAWTDDDVDHVEALLGVELPDELDVGVVLGVVEVVDCVRTSASPWAVAGQWHWLLARPRQFHAPPLARGRLGLWRCELDPEALR